MHLSAMLSHRSIGTRLTLITQYNKLKSLTYAASNCAAPHLALDIIRETAMLTVPATEGVTPIGAQSATRRFAIRQYNKSDIDDCVRFGRLMHGESAFFDIPFEESIVRGLLNLAVDKEQYYGIVARDANSNELIGFGLYFLGPYFFSSKGAVYDMVTYVVPSWRGSTLGKRLITHAERWGKDKGAYEVILGTTTKINTEMVEKFYEALGYDRVGSVYKLRIK